MELPEGWIVHPLSVTFNMEHKGEEASIPFRISPPEGQSVGELKVKINSDGKVYDKSLTIIDYPHIPYSNALSYC